MKRPKEGTASGKKAGCRKCIWWLVSCLLLAVLLCLGISLHLMYQDDVMDQYNPTPDSGVMKKLLAGALTGQETTLSEGEVNGLLAYYFASLYRPKEGAVTVVQGAQVRFSPEPGRVSLYVPCDSGGTHLAVSAVVDVSFEPASGNLWLDLAQTRIGRLKVPKSIALSVLQKNLPEEIRVQDGRLCIQTKELSVSAFGVQIPLSLETFTLTGSTVALRVTPLLEPVKEQLLQKLRDALPEGSSLLQNIEQWGSSLLDWLEHNGS